jgi:hypothetical protein
LHVLGTPPAFTLSQDQTLHQCFDCASLSLSKRPRFRVPQKESSAMLLLSAVWLLAVGFWPLAHSSSTPVRRRSLFTPLAFVPSISYWHACHTDNQAINCQQPNCSTANSSFSAPLCSCSGACSKGHKKPDGLRGASGPHHGTLYVPARRCLGSSILAPSPPRQAVTVVKRHSRSATVTIRHQGPA